MARRGTASAYRTGTGEAAAGRLSRESVTDTKTHQEPSAPCFIARDLSLPIVATAIHAGHRVRPEVADLIALDAAQRLREEDPYTDRWTTVVPARVVGTHSRFEVDLNRPRDGAVYRSPDEAWGLTVWREPLPTGVIERSLARYDAFYEAVGELLDELHGAFGAFAVLDLHSYNHLRDGPAGEPAALRENPEVNIGTSILDRSRFGRALERFGEALRAPVAGEALDVREDVKFRGGHFSRWIMTRYRGEACSLAVEFKKTFMDEWTGEPDEARIRMISGRLTTAVPVLLAELGRVGA